jgi:hypothetical protein
MNNDEMETATRVLMWGSVAAVVVYRSRKEIKETLGPLLFLASAMIVPLGILFVLVKLIKWMWNS